jgi:TRAP-type C4-dicarboxylate transport system permease small subunit
VPLAIEDWATVIIMGLLACITFANVLVRYFTDSSFAWTEEFSVFLMILLAMVAGSAAVARDRHIRIEYFAESGTMARRKRLAQFGALMVAGALLPDRALKRARGVDDYRFEETSPGHGVPQWWYSVWLPIVLRCDRARAPVGACSYGAAAGGTPRTLGELTRRCSSRPSLLMMLVGVPIGRGAGPRGRGRHRAGPMPLPSGSVCSRCRRTSTPARASTPLLAIPMFVLVGLDLRPLGVALRWSTSRSRSSGRGPACCRWWRSWWRCSSAASRARARPTPAASGAVMIGAMSRAGLSRRLLGQRGRRRRRPPTS